MRILARLGTVVYLSACAVAAEPTPGEPAAVTGPDLATFKSADELWAHLQKLQEPPPGRPASREEATKLFGEWLDQQQAACAAFQKRFPDDRRKWDAMLMGVRASVQRAQMSSRSVSLEAEQKNIDAILNAPDASEGTKGDAGFLRLMLLTNDLDENKPETFARFHKAAGEWLGKHGSHKLAPQVRITQVQVLRSAEIPGSEALLEELAGSGDAQASAQAKEVLSQRKRMAALKKHPLELKFTATNGGEIDLEKMRGKVVLVDFWASWCGPCIGELPNVVATYNRLHDKGFEIVGISLDQDKAKMEEAIKKLGISWAQHFDGGGWQNKISTAFGIRSIPAAWLLDKKGMVRQTDLRGDALGAAVEKLLQE